MAGNVAEWVADVYRPMVDDEVSDFNYFRGNEYEKNKLDNKGKAVIITDVKDVKYETLSNGKIIARSLPGQITQTPVDDNETYLRQNFDKSYEVNYRDGDKQSTNDFGNAGVIPTNDSKGMYNSPIHNVTVAAGVVIKKDKDVTNTRTTLVNDKVRVYKGGSWRDRAYWMDPAQRRYFPQDMATDYIGFRCAMSKVGPKADKKKRARN
jgi:gliding motility-associated lipoprotein GldJ